MNIIYLIFTLIILILVFFFIKQNEKDNSSALFHSNSQFNNCHVTNNHISTENKQDPPHSNLLPQFKRVNRYLNTKHTNIKIDQEINLNIKANKEDDLNKTEIYQTIRWDESFIKEQEQTLNNSIIDLDDIISSLSNYIDIDLTSDKD